MGSSVDWDRFWSNIGKMILISIAILFWCCILQSMAVFFNDAAHPWAASTFFCVGAILSTTAAIEMVR